MSNKVLPKFVVALALLATLLVFLGVNYVPRISALSSAKGNPVDAAKYNGSDYFERHPSTIVERVNYVGADWIERHPSKVAKPVNYAGSDWIERHPSNYYNNSEQFAQPASVSVFATGLNNPRGLKFGPDGYLYVAEGGTATNQLSTVGECDQVPVPIGPYTGGFTSRISKISPDGKHLTVVADHLPSSQTSPDLGNLVSGVADIAFIGDTLYGIEAGAGCSHGLAGTDNTVFRVNSDGTTTSIANLSAFQKANPVANPELDDFEPDGTWYSMVSLGSVLYAIEPNHGELDRILLNGNIMRIIDISASQGHTVPTALTFHEGGFYVGNLSNFPVVPGTAEILKITNGGVIKSTSTGLTTVLGVAFDDLGRMYALETDTVAGFPGPDAAGSGKVVRVNDDGTLTTVASGLVFPTAMTFGPDGALYVSNFGFGVPDANAGQIVRIVTGD